MGRPLSGKALACLRSSKSFVIKLSRFSQSSGICFISRILAYVCMLNLRSTDTKIWKRATLWNRIENTHPEIYKPENEVFFTNAGMENGSFVSSFHSCSPTSPSDELKIRTRSIHLKRKTFYSHYAVSHSCNVISQYNKTHAYTLFSYVFCVNKGG